MLGMRDRLLLLVAMSSMLSAPTLVRAKDEAIGNWIGGMTLGGRYDFVTLKVAQPDSAKASIYFRHMNETVPIRLGHSAMAFALHRDNDSLVFKGRIGDDTVRGRVSTSDASGTFVFRRWRPIDEPKAAEYTGAYEVRPGIVITIHVLGHELYFYDPESGRYGLALPLAQDEFFAGPTYLQFDPVALRFRFSRDPQGRLLLHLRRGTGHEVIARKGAFAEEEVHVRNGPVILSGTLRIPTGRGPHPAVVMIAGSGPQTRDGFDSHLRIHSDLLAANGFVVLSYDKRGVGGSTGDYRIADPEELASDAAAAVAFLRSRPEVDSTKVGLFGASQGGMIEPFVAARDTTIAFVVNVGGTIVDGEQQEVYRVEAQMAAEGYPDEETHEAVALQILKFYYARTGMGWESYSAARTRNQGKKWLAEVVRFAPEDKSSTSWEFWRKFNVDLSQQWARVRSPVLLIYGGLDPQSPIDRSIELFRNTVRSSGNSRTEVKLYPGANHVLLKVRGSAEADEQLTRGYDIDYLRYLVAWMKRHAGMNSRGAGNE